MAMATNVADKMRNATPANLAAVPLSAVGPKKYCPGSGPLIGSKCPDIRALMPHHKGNSENGETMSSNSVVCSHVGSFSSDGKRE